MTIRRIRAVIVTAAAILAVALAGATGVSADPPFGNDGGFCHGANMETCRPDPQPSHGAECEAHGNNPDGNDDHCSITSPAPTSTFTPTAVPSVTPTFTPIPSEGPTGAPSFEPTSTPIPPAPTLPATDTQEATT